MLSFFLRFSFLFLSCLFRNFSFSSLFLLIKKGLFAFSFLFLFFFLFLFSFSPFLFSLFPPFLLFSSL